jgi:hypothetical protein
MSGGGQGRANPPGFLSTLVDGPKSLCRMLETSRKYSLVWERVQSTVRLNDVLSPKLFARQLRNLSFNDARFDSRTMPLMKLLMSLPLIVTTLELLMSEGDDEDVKWARELVFQFSGDEGQD